MAERQPDASRLILGECVEVMANLDTASVASVVCDPPYEIGFLDRDWDNAGVSYQRETWAAALQALKPGGYLLAFGASRTYHRMTVAIEDAGFEIRDCLEWIYGGAMPKARAADDLVDRKLGVEREIVGHALGTDTSVTRPGFTGAAHSRVANARKEYAVTVATSEEAKEWDGWKTAIRPAHEPIVLARRPLDGSIAENLLAHGVGALNIEATRIGDEGGTKDGAAAGGRWPSNVLLGHSAECLSFGNGHTELCVEGCPARLVDEIADGAARFFYCAKPRTRERVGGTIRNLHPTVKPIDLMRWLVRLVTPPGGIVLDPFMGSGTTGCAAMAEGVSFVGIEQDADSFETALARISDYAFAHGRSRPAVT